MICSICLGESNQLPMYSCGHHFHAKCLHTAALHGKREAEQLDRPFKTIVQCPYCRQYIDLFKSTRTDNNYIKFNNEFAWLICHYKYSNNEKNYDNIGYCEVCRGKDNITQMRVIESDGSIEWLCNTCQSRSYKWDEQEIEYFDSSKYKEEIVLQLFNYVWKNRNIVRRNVVMRKVCIKKGIELYEEIGKLKMSHFPQVKELKQICKRVSKRL